MFAKLLSGWRGSLARILHARRWLRFIQLRSNPIDLPFPFAERGQTRLLPCAVSGSGDTLPAGTRPEGRGAWPETFRKIIYVYIIFFYSVATIAAAACPANGAASPGLSSARTRTERALGIPCRVAMGLDRAPRRSPLPGGGQLGVLQLKIKTDRPHPGSDFCPVSSARGKN